MKNLLLPAIAIAASAAFFTLPDKAQSAGPSYDCANPESRAEELICGDRELSAMDVETTRLFKLVDTGKDSQTRQSLADDKKRWVTARDECWMSDDTRNCIVSAYVRRIHALRENHIEARSQDDGGITTGPVQIRCDHLATPLKATFIASVPPVGAVEWRHRVHVGVADGDRFVEPGPDQGLSFWKQGEKVGIAFPDGKHYHCRMQK
jgi:uncharacterized protein